MIDDAGEQRGIMSTADALALAEERGLELVEMAPNAEPPVARVMDYGKYKYEQEKAQQKQKKSKAGQVKEVRLTMKIGAHDLEYRMTRAKEFLAEGQKVKLNLMMKGRENANPGAAVQRLKDIANSIPDIRIEAEPVRAGRSVSTVITSTLKPGQKSKPATDAPEATDDPAADSAENTATE